MYVACLPPRKIQAGKVVKAIDGSNVRMYMSFNF